ncbi:hypothetical protein P43SY_003360 [Pythium insidiosum]|uniref:Uncharacterized protein n=1 Tax=Pythium insidiosum TaxID=114742 RepID=A0AAD5M227_PYTIN|nr:hypothetical protein P43SY_003360 [Pythium insidiosum]
MQTSPCSQLLENVRPAPVSLNLEALESLPLMELLLQAEQPLSAPKMRATSVERKPNAEKQKAPTTLGIHNQINRLIGRISKPTGVAVPLTSHSFRAQHANSEAGMSMQWISDRGAQAGLRRDQLLAVSMRLQETYRDGQQQTETKPTSNTTVSDQQTALIRELLKANRLLVNRLQALEEKWYAGELRLWSKDADRKKRSEMMTSSVVSEASSQAGLRRDQLLAVSMRLQETYRDGQQQTETKPTSNTTVSDQQTALIRELLKANRLLVNRLQALEEKWYAGELRLWSKDADRKKRSEARHVVAFRKLFLPRWSKDADRKKRSEARHVVAFMKLFLVRGFSLDADAPTYRDNVMRLGHEAEQAVARFLAEQGIKSMGSSAVLKHMRALHKHGKLNHLIREYKGRLAFGAVVDPCPRDTWDILAFIEA